MRETFSCEVSRSHVWVAVRSSLRQVLDDTSLEQLRSGELPQHVRDLAQEPDAWLSR